MITIVPRSNRNSPHEGYRRLIYYIIPSEEGLLDVTIPQKQAEEW
jgi:hypothetical protein